MDELRNGLGEGVATAATFVPKFIGFLLILVIGYFVAKAIAIMVLAFFAAADQLEINPTIVNTLFTGLVVLLVGSGIVGHRWWRYPDHVPLLGACRSACRAGVDQSEQEAQGSGERIQRRAQERKEQLQPTPPPATPPTWAGATAAPPARQQGTN